MPIINEKGASGSGSIPNPVTAPINVAPTAGGTANAPAISVTPKATGEGVVVSAPAVFTGDQLAAFNTFNGEGAQVLGDGSFRAYSATNNLLGVGATVDSQVNINDTGIGFYTHAPAAKQTVTGAKLPADDALASLLAALVAIGLITNSTT